VETSHRSRRAEVAALRAELTAKGAPVRQIASLIRTRYNLGARTAYRYAHGLTQQQVADRWNELWPPVDGAAIITHKHISYWEAWPLRTGRPPSVETLNRLARIYRTSAAELLDGEDHSQPSTTLALASSETVKAEPVDVLTRVDRFIAAADSLATRESDYDQLVANLIEWACRMKRRDILQWLSSAAAAAAAAPVLDGLDPGEQARVASAFATPSRVDSTVIGDIEGVLWRCMRQDDALGPQAALDTTLAQRNLVRGLLPDAPDAFRDDLRSLYANLSRFAGWFSFDLGNYDAAGHYYETARASAHEAHNTELGALVLCNLSHLATWRRQPRTGIDHALAAIGWANQTDDARLRAYAYDVAARAYAMDRQDRATHKAIEQARAAFADGDERTDTYAYFFSAGQLASTESVCYLQLGQADKGIEAAKRSLTGIDGSFVRNLALTSLRLGICYLHREEPDVDRGASAIADAVRLAAHNRSVRLVERLQWGWRELESWHDTPAAKNVRDQMLHYGIG
jgi:transcriptional regulator with XRE-family HTH domain